MEGKLTKPWIHKTGDRMWTVDVPAPETVEDTAMWWADGESHEEALLHLEGYYHWTKTGVLP